MLNVGDKVLIGKNYRGVKEGSIATIIAFKNHSWYSRFTHKWAKSYDVVVEKDRKLVDSNGWIYEVVINNRQQGYVLTQKSVTPLNLNPKFIKDEKYIGLFE